MSEREKSVKENADKVTDTLSKVSDRVTDKQTKINVSSMNYKCL